MNNHPYEQFLACFNSSFEIVVSTDELKKRMVDVNSWLLTLNKKEREKQAADMARHLEQAQRNIKQKQDVLEEIILANRSTRKANVSYGRY